MFCSSLCLFFLFYLASPTRSRRNKLYIFFFFFFIKTSCLKLLRPFNCPVGSGCWKFQSQQPRSAD
ncbi:unnamed protein product [Ixodes pacificus]